MLLSRNQDIYFPGDFLSLDVGVETEAGQLQPRSDLYLALVLPNGTIFCLDPHLAFGRANQLLPVVRNWEIQNFPLTTVLSLSIPEGTMAGTYQWWLVLVRAGTDVSNSSNWLGSAHTSFDIQNE